jgi:hypothetical protein
MGWNCDDGACCERGSEARPAAVVTQLWVGCICGDMLKTPGQPVVTGGCCGQSKQHYGGSTVKVTGQLM